MAVDSANKRASVSGDMLPFPDGAINKGDRQHTAGDYRGIPAAVPGALPGRIHLQELLQDGEYPKNYTQFAIAGTILMWFNQKLIEVSTSSIKYDLVDDYMILRP